MSACEGCWSEASRRAAILGGATADRYREVLAEHPDGHTRPPLPPTDAAAYQWPDIDIAGEENERRNAEWWAES